MAHYKHIDTSPQFLPVDLSRQLRPVIFIALTGGHAPHFTMPSGHRRMPWRGMPQAGSPRMSALSKTGDGHEDKSLKTGASSLLAQTSLRPASSCENLLRP